MSKLVKIECWYGSDGRGRVHSVAGTWRRMCSLIERNQSSHFGRIDAGDFAPAAVYLAMLSVVFIVERFDELGIQGVI